jgi:hypothetical protein
MMRVRFSGGLPLLAAVAVIAAVAEAQGPVNISSLVNDDLTTYTNGSNYPQNGGLLTVAGINFTLSTIAPSSHTAVIQSSTTAGVLQTFSIPVGRFGVTTVYTLMDGAFGSCGTSVGELDFVGAVTPTFVYVLTEGVNIRDHNMVSGFCQTATGVAGTASFGGEVRLDMQQITLPAGFATDTLTAINFKSYGLAGAGSPFVAAVDAVGTGTTPPATPAPTSLFLALIGLAGAAVYLAWRKRAQAA